MIGIENEFSLHCIYPALFIVGLDSTSLLHTHMFNFIPQ